MNLHNFVCMDQTGRQTKSLEASGKKMRCRPNRVYEYNENIWWALEKEDGGWQERMGETIDEHCINLK